MPSLTGGLFLGADHRTRGGALGGQTAGFAHSGVGHLMPIDTAIRILRCERSHGGEVEEHG